MQNTRKNIYGKEDGNNACLIDSPKGLNEEQFVFEQSSEIYTTNKRPENTDIKALCT